ncbi:hypothetical protein [Flavobacterium sp. AG291]|uniref:hypothetical protein n=1 Tax=Flavobacterium sp. AG291 TaxID=2184000 RepID=UPI000E0CA2B9|nr:hypothetical protein [Flavobacterium sp. AG291]RDI07036.1 hypothetical protein DEU42_113136 [Flavobacterium sp. AG291]
MKAGTIVIVGGLAILGIAVLTAKKVLVLKAVFDRMKIWPSDISNVKLKNFTELSFNLNFMLQNPTNESFSVSGANIVTLKRVSIYKNGTYFGQADVNLTELEIPANSTTELKNLPFKVSLTSLLDNLANMTEFDVTSITTGLSVEAVVEVLGSEYVIEG